VTGEYNTCFTIHFNDEDYADITDCASDDYEMGCKMEIIENDVVSFTHGSLEAGSSSTASLHIRAEAIGDCGSEFQYVLTLHSDDTDQMDVTTAVELSELDKAAILSDSGLTFNYPVSRDDAYYALFFSIEAVSPVRDDGWIKLYAEDMSDFVYYGGIPCAVVIDSFTLDIDTVAEVSLTSFKSEYEFALQWEPNCENLNARIRVYNDDDEVIGETNVGHDAIVAENWEAVVNSVNYNKLEVYRARLQVRDLDHETVVQFSDYINFEHWPLCHLYVDSFSQESFDWSMDEAHFELGVGVALSHQGDQACEQMAADIHLYAGESLVFTHELSASDLQAAIAGSFEFTIVEDSDADVTHAVIEFTDPRSENDATSGFDVVYPSMGGCEIAIENFCLVDVVETDVAGEAQFDFSLVVRSTPACHELDVSLDIVQEGNYLGNVVIDSADIVSAVECNCETTFQVTASAAIAGEFYGQIDVREPSTGKIYISDSTPFAVPV